MSQSDTLSSRPLLRCSPFLPGESLPSLVARLVILNGYSSLSILERLFQSNYPVRWERPFQESELNHLAILTRLSQAELLAASDIHFTPSSPSLFIPVHPTRSAWYCPHCLAEAAYHRLIWRPISSAACLKHACQLKGGCPRCQQPVSVYDIVRSRCSHCNFDLRKAIPIPVAENEPIWVSQTAMRSWLVGDSVPDRHWPLQPPAVLSRLAHGLALGIAYLSLHHHYPGFPDIPYKSGLKGNLLQRLAPIQILQAYGLAVQCMANWPEGFRRFLYWCEPDLKRDPAKSMRTLFPYLGGNLWNGNSSRFIWEAFHTFSYDRLCLTFGHPELGLTSEQLPAYANESEAAQILAVSKEVLQDLVEKKLLSPARIWRNEGCLFYFKREELRNLSQYI